MTTVDKILPKDLIMKLEILAVFNESFAQFVYLFNLHYLRSVLFLES